MSQKEASALQPKMSQSDLAYSRLREGIISLDLGPGEMYSETSLAEFAGLGRTPVREALHRLIREELVQARRNKGILVVPIDVFRQLQLLDVRRVLEHLMSRRACEQARVDERRQMLAFATVIEAAAVADDSRAFNEANRDIQDLKMRATHNETIRSTMDLFLGLSRRFWVAYHGAFPGSLHAAAGFHARILRAIAMSNPPQAVQASDELIDFLEDLTRKTVELTKSVSATVRFPVK